MDVQFDWDIQSAWYGNEMKAENLYFLQLIENVRIKLVEFEWNNDNVWLI